MNRNWVSVLAASAMLATAAYAVSCCAPEKVVSDVPAYAYVGNQSSNSISGYAISNSTGELAAVPGSPFTGPSGPRQTAVELFGKYLYVANGDASGVYGFSIDSTTGALAALSGSPFAGGSGPRGIVVDFTGQFLYTANRNDNTVSGYAISASTGALTQVPGSPFTIPAEGEQQPGPQKLTIDPSGRFLYVSNHLTGNISGFTINATTGALTLISGSPFSDQETPSVNLMPFALAVAPSGKFLYVTNHGPSTISVYSIDGTSGALTATSGSPFPIPPPSECAARPFGAAIGLTGQFLYVADNGCGAISIFNLDPNTGAPAQISSSPVFINVGENDCSAGPNDDTIDATGRFLYVAEQSCGLVSAYSINTSTGAIAEVAGSPYPAGNQPYGVAISRIN
jgi:6-phosphogluconolactonase (cycloisomerase 2 family)